MVSCPNVGAVANVVQFNGNEVEAWLAKFDLLLLHKNVPDDRHTLELLVSLSAAVTTVVMNLYHHMPLLENSWLQDTVT